jgi:hypothetical protein
MPTAHAFLPVITLAISGLVLLLDIESMDIRIGTAVCV